MRAKRRDRRVGQRVPASVASKASVIVSPGRTGKEGCFGLLSAPGYHDKAMRR
jgi:hypothetical protein